MMMMIIIIIACRSQIGVFDVCECSIIIIVNDIIIIIIPSVAILAQGCLAQVCCHVGLFPNRISGHKHG